MFVVYRTIPTSNHNFLHFDKLSVMLYIVLFLHQTTTGTLVWTCFLRLYIVLFLHQTTTNWSVRTSSSVVYRTIPTSNHNLVSILISIFLLYIVLFLHQTTTATRIPMFRKRLYIVLFLHQTTTWWLLDRCVLELYIVLFLHQTTTAACRILFCSCCISYYSYIKPQLGDYLVVCRQVVYRTIPTSNHN